MSSPPAGGAGDPSQSPGPIPRPPSLQKLRSCEQGISVILEEIRVIPDRLDTQASEVHEKFVIIAYRLMTSEVARVCGARWKADARKKFSDTYFAAANKWPAYREAIAELESAHGDGGSVVPAMRRLEKPRHDYITALGLFYGQLSETLGFFFPG
jgi:hypothetical protein